MIFDRLFEEKLNEYKSSVEKDVANFKLPKFDIHKEETQSLIKVRDEVERIYQVASEYKVPQFVNNLESEIQNEVNSKFDGFYEIIEDLNSKEQQEISEIENKKSEIVADIESRYNQRREVVESKVNPTAYEHYKFRSVDLVAIEDLMKEHKISGIRLDTSGLTIEEISKRIKLAKVIAKDMKGTENIFDKVVSLLYFPSKNPVTNDTDKMVRLSHFTVILILSFLLKPWFWGIFGLFYLIVSLGRLVSISKRKHLLAAVSAIGTEIDFTKFVETDAELIKLKEVLEQAKALDLTDKLNAIKDKYKTLREEKLSEGPEVYRQQLQDELTMNFTVYTETAQEMTKSLESGVNALVNRIKVTLELIEVELKTRSEQLKTLGSEITISKILGKTVKVAKVESAGVILGEYSVELPENRINFWYSDERERAEQVGFIKVLLVNYLMNIRRKYLTVHIYDRLKLGMEFAEFKTGTLSEHEVIKFYVSNLDDMSKALKEQYIKAQLKTAGETAKQFNEKAVVRESSTIQYHLAIVIADSTSISSEEWLNFTEVSSQQGIEVWTLVSKKEADEDKERNARDGKPTMYDRLEWKSSNAYVPYKLQDENGNLLFGNYEEPLTPYKYDPSLIRKTITTLEDAINSKVNIDILDYFQFLNMHVPEDKYWTYSTNKGIKLHPGALDGDKSVFQSLELGDNSVHGLMAGRTGGGKSVAINAILATMLHMYPPEELELYMIDFKVVEFLAYAKGGCIPHAALISGTKDGTYAISIFKYMTGELARRNKLFADVGAKKIENYNNLITNGEITATKLPRILLIIDEFQVMFNAIEPKFVQQIQPMLTRLAKEARAAGIHMWFTSQSMTNTLPGDTLEQFGMRMALALDSQTSTTVLGNKAANTELKEKGWMLSNTSTTREELTNKIWQVPYIPDEKVAYIRQSMRDRAISAGHLVRSTQVYDEDEKFDLQYIYDYYINNTNSRDKYGFFVVGPKCIFDPNNPEMTFQLEADDRNNIAIYGSTSNKISTEIALSLMENIKQRNNTRVIALSPNISTVEGLNLPALNTDQPVVEAFGLDRNVRVDTIMELLNVIHDEQKEIVAEVGELYYNKNPNRLETYVFIFDMNKVPEFESSGGSREYLKLEELAKQCGRSGLHIVFITNIPKSNYRLLGNVCNYKLFTRMSETDATMYAEEKEVSKMENHMSYLITQEESTKFKICLQSKEG